MVQVSPLRTQSLPLRRRRSLRRVMIVSPTRRAASVVQVDLSAGVQGAVENQVRAGALC